MWGMVDCCQPCPAAYASGVWLAGAGCFCHLVPAHCILTGDSISPHLPLGWQLSLLLYPTPPPESLLLADAYDDKE